MAEPTSAATSSINPNFPPLFYRGLPAIGTFALLSVISTVTLFSFISYRLITSRQHYRTYVGLNQYVILIYNLALADLMQALSFIISFHWLQRREIDSNSNWCFGQGFLIHIGDVASAFFVLAIAMHTWFRVVKNREIPYSIFIGVVAFLWILAMILTILAPIMRGKHVFVQSGAWCWINSKYETDRLALHYVWVFIVEFSSFLIYVWIFIYLLNYQRRNGLRDFGQTHANAKKLVWASRAMLAYPVVYTMFTIPLAGGRMASYAGHKIPDVYWIAAGCFMTSCGWADALIYTLTRRILLKQESSANNATFQSMNMSTVARTRKTRSIVQTISVLGKAMNPTKSSSHDDFETELSRNAAAGIGVTCETASDDMEIKGYEERTSDASLVDPQTPPPVHKEGRHRSTTTSTSHSPERRPPLLSRMYFNNRNSANEHGNMANVEIGGFTRLHALNTDGIIVTNDVRVDSVHRSEFRGRAEGDTRTERSES